MLVQPSSARWTERRREIAEHALRDLEQLAIKEWVEKEGRLPEGDAEPGPYRLARTPYMAGIFDAINNPRVEKVVVMKGTQLGLTIGMLLALFYFVRHKPRRVLQALPTEQFAKKWAREKLTPMLEAMPDVDRLMGDVKGGANALLAKTFPGGFLNVIGMNSSRQLRSSSAPIVFVDELDEAPHQVGDQGDPLQQLEKRTQTYADRKLILNSSPTIAGISRIDQEYEDSDQGKLYVPCPHCEHFQVLKWGGPDAEYGIKWDRGDNGEHLTDTAYYLCENCAATIEERSKRWMLARHEWRSDNPGHPAAGFHIPSMYSLFPRARWRDMAGSWVKSVKDPEKLQVFWNTLLGEPWEERGTKATPTELEARQEIYVNTEGERAEVPEGVGVLTAFIDVQGDRLELEVDGWGEGEENWTILHERIVGNPENQNTWARLEALLVKPYSHVRGGSMHIDCTLIDSGYEADLVYRFVRVREHRNVFAAKGYDGMRRDPISRSQRKTDDGVTLFTLGVDPLKKRVVRRLGVEKPGPGYIHFAKPMSGSNGLDAEYFAQRAAEKMVRRRKPGSRAVTEHWIQVRDRNEALDLKVGNLAALMVLGLGERLALGALAKTAGTPGGRKTGRRRKRVRSKGVRG